MIALARGYGIPLIDYCREGDGLLVSSGAGIMMAVMDAARTVRWCLDIDSIRLAGRSAQLASWLEAAQSVAGRVYICGWFSITDPAPLRDAVSRLRLPPLAYTPGAHISSWSVQTLDSFLAGIE